MRWAHSAERAPSVTWRLGNMAVRLFEGKEQAAAYLQYRVVPHELISTIMKYMEKKVRHISCHL